MIALARLIRTAAWVVAALIVAAILLYVFSANSHNGLVGDIHSAAGTLVGPFKGLFSIGSRKGSLALNWGLAAVVYMAVGHLLAGLIGRTAVGGFRQRRMRPVA